MACCTDCSLLLVVFVVVVVYIHFAVVWLCVPNVYVLLECFIYRLSLLICIPLYVCGAFFLLVITFHWL